MEEQRIGRGVTQEGYPGSEQSSCALSDLKIPAYLRVGKAYPVNSVSQLCFSLKIFSKACAAAFSGVSS